MTIQPDEQTLIAQAKAGDRSAFEVLVKRYSESIFRLAYRMLVNHDDAEDVRQETFLNAFRHLSRFRNDASFSTWLYAIAVKRCLTWRRRLASRKFLAYDELSYVQAPVCESEGVDTQQTLMQLAPPDRLLLILKYVEGLSHEEIARVLGCSAESSRARLLRAKKLFRERFGKEDGA